MQNIINTITQNIEAVGALVVALAALISTIIVQYKKLKKLWAGLEISDIVAPLAAEAEEHPEKVLNYIDDKTGLSDIDIRSNEGKQMVVATAATEIAQLEAPKAMKRLGITDVGDMLGVVDTVYQSMVKPIVKIIKKKK